jgi:UPF0755 protein
MKKKLITILLAVLFIAGLCSYFPIDLYLYSKRPVNPVSGTPTIITISKGQSFNALVNELHQRHLINFPLKFKLIARLNQFDRKIIAGEYELSGAMSPQKILTHLTTGTVRLHRLTIPEGFTVNQIADTVEKSSFCSKNAFIAAATDPEITQQMKIQAQSLEGYLFPDTYYFSKDITPKQIIASMVNQFHMTYKTDWEKQAEKLGFSMHEIITLASIIEKETGVASERPIIASVFHNRLRKKMRLASDPTVIYGIKDFNGNITKKDLNRRTPYNTYMVSGLPPGPIANPGAKSIKAALWPAKTNFLYFVAKTDNTHQFSTTLKEHNRAVRKYQLKKGGR